MLTAEQAALIMMSGGGDADFGAIEFNANGTYTPQSVQADVDGWNQVTVSVPLSTLAVTANGTYTAQSGGYNQVTVNVPTGGGSGPALEHILQNITYLDGQFVAGDYTYKIGWVWYDWDVEQYWKNSDRDRPTSRTVSQPIYSGDGTSSRSSVGTEYYSYPPYEGKRLGLFNVLFKDGEPIAAWYNYLDTDATYTNNYILQQRYMQYYYNGAYHYCLENGQQTTEAGYKAAYYNSTPHTDGIFHSVISRKLELVSCSGSFSYDTTSFNIANVMKDGRFPITVVRTYEIDYVDYTSYPTTRYSAEEVTAKWGADWGALFETYGGSAANYITQTCPPRPAATGTGVWQSRNQSSYSGTLYFIPYQQYFGEVSVDEWVDIYNEVAQSLLNTLSPSDKAVMSHNTPEYVPNPTT